MAWEACFWGLVAGSALVLGAAIGLMAHLSQRTVSLFMALGAGFLASAVVFQLTREALDRAGPVPLVLGMLAGGGVFSLGDAMIWRMGGGHRKRSGGGLMPTKGAAIALGSILDDMPEAFAIGLSVLGQGHVSWALLTAVFIGNLAEGLPAAIGMRRAGHSPRFVIGMWLLVMGACGMSAFLGYILLDPSHPFALATALSFAAGAMLAMLASTMLPEAMALGGPGVGLATVLGFLGAFLTGYWLG